MADTPTLELQVKENSEQAIKGLEALAASLDQLKEKLSISSGLGVVAESLGKLKTSFDSTFTTDIANRITKVADGLERVQNASKFKMPTIKANGSDIKNLADSLSGMKAKNSELVEAARETSALQQAKETIANSKQQIAINNARKSELAVMDSEQMVRKKELELEKHKLQTEKLGRQNAKLFEELYGATEKTAKSIDDNRKSSAGLAKTLDKMLKPLGQIIRSFGRILFYRVIRNVLKQIGESFKEGLENVRAYSKAIDGSFNKAMTSMENSLFKMKNSLGAALAPALEAIIPYVQQLVSWFITLVNYVNQFFALMGGKTQWTRATDASASSLDKVKKSAGGAAKEVKNLLAGFDELNIIQSESGGGGGGGAGALTPDYTTMFEEVYSFDERIKNIVNWLKENADDLLRVVKEIGLAIAAWRISNVFGGWISKLAGLAATALVIKIVWDMVTLFDKQYLKTGDISYLLWNALATGVGAVITQQVVDKMLGSGMGKVSAGLTIAVSAVADIVALIGNKDVSVFDPKALAIELMSAIKAATAGYLVFRHGGLSVSRSLQLSAGVALFTVGAAVGVKAIASAIETDDFGGDNLKAILTSSITMGGGVAIIGSRLFAKSGAQVLAGGVGTAFAVLGAYVGIQAIVQAVDAGWTADTIRKAALSSIGIGAGSMLLALMAGASLGVAGIVGGVAGVATVGAIVGVTAILKAEKKNVHWGSYVATEQEIQSYVNEKMFTIDVPTTVNLINTTIGNAEEADAAIRSEATKLFAEMNVLRLGINEDDAYKNIATQVLGESLDGSGGLVGKLKKDIEGKKQTVKLALSLVPATDNNGVDKSGELLSTSIEGWDKIQSKLTSLGESLSGYLVDPATKQLRTDLQDFEKTAVNEILGVLQRVSSTITSAQITNQAMATLSTSLLSMTEPSAKEAFKAFGEYRKQLTEGFTQIEYAAAQTYIEQAEAAKELARSAKTEEERAAFETEAKAAMDAYEAFIAGIDERINAKVEEHSRTGVLQIKNTLEKVYGHELGNVLRAGNFAGAYAKALGDSTSGVSNEYVVENLVEALKNTTLKALHMTEQELADYGLDFSMFLPDSVNNTLFERVSKDFGQDVALALAERLGIALPEEITDAIKQAEEQAKAELAGSDIELQEILDDENNVVPEEPVELPVIPVLPEGTDLISDIFGPDPGVELVFAINEESFEQPVPAPDMSPVVDAVDQARKDVTDDVNEMLRQMERLNTLGFSYDAIFRGGAGGSRFNTYSLFADGGFVGNGDLFMAREAGPELVGRIGSRTAVANNDQIVAGVAGGVAAGQAEQNALLRQQNDLLRQMVAKSGRVEAVPSSDWGRFIQRSSQMYANNTGA